jgi:hypothetical protein
MGAGINDRVTNRGPQRPMPTSRAEKLRQVIARYERLAEGASPELAAVYAAELAAIRGMLARIEAADNYADPATDPGTGLPGSPTAAATIRRSR